jgi:hypothetical protein
MVIITDRLNQWFDYIFLVTGDDAENEDASPSKKTKGRSGRKANQKSKNNNQENDNETGNKRC